MTLKQHKNILEFEMMIKKRIKQSKFDRKLIILYSLDFLYSKCEVKEHQSKTIPQTAKITGIDHSPHPCKKDLPWGGSSQRIVYFIAQKALL